MLKSFLLHPVCTRRKVIFSSIHVCFYTLPLKCKMNLKLIEERQDDRDNFLLILNEMHIGMAHEVIFTLANVSICAPGFYQSNSSIPTNGWAQRNGKSIVRMKCNFIEINAFLISHQKWMDVLGVRFSPFCVRLTPNGNYNVIFIRLTEFSLNSNWVVHTTRCMENVNLALYRRIHTFIITMATEDL